MESQLSDIRNVALSQCSPITSVYAVESFLYMFHAHRSKHWSVDRAIYRNRVEGLFRNLWDHEEREGR